MNNIKVMFINPNPRNMSLVQPVVSPFYVIYKQYNIEMFFLTRLFMTSLKPIQMRINTYKKFLLAQKEVMNLN